MRSKRALLLLAAAFAVLVMAAAVLALVLVPRFIEREVLRQARARGFELELGTLDYGWRWVELRNTKARLIGVRALALHFGDLMVTLDGMDIGRVEAAAVRASAQGSLPELAVELGAWSKRFPQAYGIPVAARDVSVEWRPDPAAAPWLSISGGTVASTAAGTVVSADRARLAGADVGRIGATWSKTTSSVALGFGETELGKAPLRAVVDFAAARPTVVLTLAPTQLERLARPFAVELPVEDVIGAAEVNLTFANRDAALPERGHTKAELRGFIPPHPAELDGFVFGDTTFIESDLVISPTGTEVTLENTSITAGKFVLRGGGVLRREPDGARLSLDLRGDLPCSTLAGAAAESRLGRLLGSAAGAKAGNVARQVVGGTVSVRVQIEARTKELAKASVVRSIGIGCGLKPLTLADLARLGETLLPEELSRLPEELGKLGVKLPPGMPSSLPPLPSGLPAMPSGFPRLPTALPPFPPFPSARGGGATKPK